MFKFGIRSSCYIVHFRIHIFSQPSNKSIPMQNILFPLFLSLIFLFMLDTAVAQKYYCADFHVGKFRIKDQYGDVIIERDKKHQTETNEKEGAKLVLKINWINDCTYTLQLEKVLKNDHHIAFPKEMVLTVEIEEIHGNSYVQVTRAKGSDKKEYRSSVVKIG